MSDRQYYIYMLSNPGRSVIYTGVTNDLARRVEEHRTAKVSSFTKNYNVTDLVWFEAADDPETAILREKQIKAGSRVKKIALIESINPTWRDLSTDLA